MVHFCKCKITYFSNKIEKAKRKRRPKKRPKTTNELSDLSSDSNTDYEEESEIGKNILQKESFFMCYLAFIECWYVSPHAQRGEHIMNDKIWNK